MRFYVMLALGTVVIANSVSAQSTDAPNTEAPVEQQDAAPASEASSAKQTVADTDKAVVWDKVALGMPRSKVEGLYPKGEHTDWHADSIEISHVPILEKCDAEVNINFDGDKVDTVKVAGNPSMGGRCSIKVLAALTGKYGEPLAGDTSHGTLLSRQGVTFIWRRDDGVTMQFKRYKNGFLGGGGLLKASWELTYSDLSDNIAL